MTPLRPASDTAQRDFKPELSLVEPAPKHADPPPSGAKVLPALPPNRLPRVEWLDLRELSEEEGTGPSMDVLGWHGPPERDLCQYSRAAARS